MDVTLSITVEGNKVYDHRKLLRNLARRPSWADKINTIHNPVGVLPGEACLLMKRSDLASLETSGGSSFGPFSISISQTATGFPYTLSDLTFPGFLLVGYHPATTDSDGLYVVYFKDKRHAYREGAVTQTYSIRQSSSNAQPSNKVLWSTAYSSIWTSVGGSPAQPSFTSPTWYPNWIDYVGRPALDAACWLHALTDEGLAYNTETSEFETFTFGATQSAYQDILAENLFFKALGKAYRPIPTATEVHFGWNWPNKSPYVRTPTPTSPDPFNRLRRIWGMGYAFRNNNSSTSPENTTDLNSEATAAQTAFYNSQSYIQKSFPRRLLIAGWYDIMPGSEVSSVRWKWTEKGVPCTEVNREPEYYLPTPERCSYIRGATRLLGTLNGAISAATATGVADGLTGIDGTVLDADSVTFDNVHLWTGNDNAICRLEQDVGGRWALYQVDCP